MARVLIAGCGYVGEATADLFAGSGWEVEGWTSSQSSAATFSDKSYAVRAVNISDREQVSAQARNNFDAVIHCASTTGGDSDAYRRVYFEGARNLLEQFAGVPMLFTSSTSVYAQTKGEWVNEESLADPKHDSGKVLRKTEELVLRRGGIVARLAGIYGPNRAALLTKFLRGEAVFDPDNDRFVNEVHRDDIAAALVLLLDRQVARGQIFNVVDDKPILQSDCYRFLARKLNKPFPPRGKSQSNRKRGDTNKRVSNLKLRSLGWVPAYPTFEEAMRKSILRSFQITIR